MVDIETIGVEFKTDGLKAGQRELDKTTQAANRTADAADKLGDATQRTGGQFRALESSLGTLRTVIGSLGVAVLVKEFIGMADAVTVLHNQLKLATGSAAAAGQAYEALYDIAQRSRVSFTELGGTYAAIARAGSQLGVSQTRLLTVTEAIGNAMTISGGSAASMQAALVQLSQGLSSGTLRGEELNSVMEQTPRLAKAIADGLGVPIGKLREMGAAGEITAEQVIKALESQSTALNKEVQGATLTVGQSFTQLGNATTKFMGEMDSATGVSKALASGLSAVAGGLTDIGKAARDNQEAISITLGVVAGAGLLAALPAIASGLKIVGVAIAGLGAILAANPVVLALLGIGAVIGGAIAIDSAQKKTLEGLRATLKELEAIDKKGNTAMYGTAVPEEAIQRRKQQIKELREQVALLDAQNLNTSAEDARLGRYNAQALAQEALRNKLNGTMSALSGVNDKYREQQAQLETLQQAYAAGMITETEYLAAVGKISAALEKQYAGTKKVKSEEEQHREVMKGVIARREAFTAAVIESMGPTEMASIEQDLWNKTMAAGQVEIDKLLKAEQTRTAALQVDVEKQRQANQMIGLSRTEIAQLEAARILDTAAILEQTAALNEQMGDMSGLNAEYRKQAAQLREMAGLKVASAFGEEMDAQRKADLTEWTRYWDQVSQGMVDSLMQGGKSVAEYLKGLFRTLVLQPILKTGVQSALGAIGLGAPAGGSGALGTINNLSSLYNTGSTVAGWLGLGAAATGTGLAATAGTGMALASGATGLGLTAGAGTGLSLAGAGTGLGLTASAGTGTALAAGAGSAGAGAGLAAIPGWGWAAAAVLAVLGSGFGKTPGEQHTGGFYSSSGASGMDAAMGITGGNDAYARDLIKRSNPEIEAMVKNTVGSVIESTTAQAKALGMDIAVGIDAGFAANTNGKGKNKNAFGYFDVTINGETVAEYVNRTLGEDVTKATAQWTTDMTDAVAEWVLGGKDVIKAGETAGQALARLSTNLTSVNGTFDVLGYRMFDASVDGAALASSLVDAFGSLERFSELTGQFYQSYYSDSERFATSQRLLRDQFAALNMTMPDSTKSFRAMVESAQAAGDSGLLASLLDLGPAFYAVANAVEDVFNSISSTTAQSVRDIEMSLLGDAEKYAYLDREIEGYITKLSTATLPAEIDKLFGQANSSTMAAWNLLSPEQQKKLGPEFIDRLYDVEAVAQSRLSVTGNQATTDDAQAQAVLDNKTAAADSRAAAKEMLDAATLYRQAAETMLAAANRPTVVELAINGKRVAANEVVFS